MDPVEIRLKNFVQANEFPYPTATGLMLRFSGDYEKPLRKALAEVDYTQLRAEQADGARRGQADGHRHLHLRRDLRHGPLDRAAGGRMGIGHGEDRAHRAKSRC